MRSPVRRCLSPGESPPGDDASTPDGPLVAIEKNLPGRYEMLKHPALLMNHKSPGAGRTSFFME